MVTQVQLGGVSVDVVLKDIKHVHLSVHPPSGRIRISAPTRMKLETIRVFAVSKLAWIKKQQKKLLEQDRETPREYLNRESHYVWGRRYLLQVVEGDHPASVELQHSKLALRVRPGTTKEQHAALLEDWYRAEVKRALPPLIAKWEKLMGVTVAQFFVQRMKTRWGSCNSKARNIRLNTDLAKKPRECLEYILIHEMVHIMEPTHNARFVALMDKYIPQWKARRELLNRLPVRHVDWGF